jgi:hypothetical protein
MPKPKARRNSTDPESRIMKDEAVKSFVQAYNAQAAVDAPAAIEVYVAPDRQKHGEAPAPDPVSDEGTAIGAMRAKPPDAAGRLSGTPES